MERFIRVNGKDFSFEEVAKALGLEVNPSVEPVQVALCQRVDDGVLVAKGAFFDKDPYPGVDVELELPVEKDSMTVMISRTEQPRPDGDYNKVRTFGYSRDDEYFMYFDVDTRADNEVDEDFANPYVVVGGNSGHEVAVYEENGFVEYKGALPASMREQELDVDKGKDVVALLKEAGLLDDVHVSVFENALRFAYEDGWHADVFLEDGKLRCFLSADNIARNIKGEVQDIKEGDAFFEGSTGFVNVASEDGRKTYPGPGAMWVVRNQEGVGFYEEEISSAFLDMVKGLLEDMEKSFAAKLENAFMRSDVDGNSGRTEEYLKD